MKQDYYGKNRRTDGENTLYKTLDKEENAHDGCMTSLEIFDFRRDRGLDSQWSFKNVSPMNTSLRFCLSTMCSPFIRMCFSKIPVVI
jgi:hypothetical protein